MLYRSAAFFEHQDTGLLPGRETSEISFNDITVARAMDAVFAGAEKVFSVAAFRVACEFLHPNVTISLTDLVVDGE